MEINTSNQTQPDSAVAYCSSQKRTYSLKEAASAIGVESNTVRRLIKEGKLKKLKIRHIRIAVDELDRFLSDGICG
jgi:excisionase family DNA binding protein